MKHLLVPAVTLFVMVGAHARDAEGRLDLLLAPSSTQPAIVTRAATFTVSLREAAVLRLESAAGSFDLPAPEEKRMRGQTIVEISLPPEIPAGTYTLVGRVNDREDRNYRSVVVLDAPLESYRIAVWSNLRIGADPARPDTELYRLSAQINASGAALVLIVGNLTAGGTHEQFRLALEILNDCNAPTLVAPGAVDFASGRVPEYFGAYPVSFSFGLDGVLLCSTPRATLGGETGVLHLERRRLRAARWSIGVASGDDLASMRGQLSVLVDDPLDVVLGLPAGAVAEPGDPSPWGRGRWFPAPTGRAALEWFTVNPQRVAIVRER